MTLRTLALAALSAALILACEVTVTTTDGDTTPTPDPTPDATDDGAGDGTVLEDTGPDPLPTACDDYCTLAEANCAGDDVIDWGEGDCQTACAGYADNLDFEVGDGGDSLDCRLYHVGDPAAADSWTHCPHASPSGGGVCVDEVTYYAVVIEDIFGGKCGSSGAPGADIDAVELQDGEGVHLAYWTIATMLANPDGDDTCSYDAAKDTDENGVDDIYEDASEAEGEPDGTLQTNFISLYGGWAAGEFGQDDSGDDLYIMDGDVIVIYEVGSAVGGQDEDFTVYVATDLDCPNGDGWRDDCAMSQGDLKGEGTVTVAIEGM